jgi:hypothetical protein
MACTITCLQVVDPPLSGYKLVFTISWPEGSVGATEINYIIIHININVSLKCKKVCEFMISKFSSSTRSETLNN